MTKTIKRGDVVRCMGFDKCRREHCMHYKYHSAKGRCVGWYRIRMCEQLHAFVSDVPYQDVKESLGLDPNLAFRVKKEEDVD